MTRKLTIVYWILLLPAFAFMPGDRASVPLLAKWVITRGCSLQVDGSTNVNNFTCSIDQYCNPDTISVFRNDGKEVTFPVTGVLNLNIEGFDCHNIFMTKDLRKTLKAAEFPIMHVRFVSLNKMPDFRLVKDAVMGLVDIELAGTMKRFDMSYTFSMDDQKIVHLMGTRAVSFTDFNLTPPRKLGGMIKTNDRLDVVFHLNMKVLN